MYVSYFTIWGLRETVLREDVVGIQTDVEDQSCARHCCWNTILVVLVVCVSLSGSKEEYLQVAQGVLDNLVPQASDKVHIEQVVKAAFAGGQQVGADSSRHAAAHGARLDLGQVDIAQCEDAHGLEQLPWTRHLMHTHLMSVPLPCS